MMNYTFKKKEVTSMTKAPNILATIRYDNNGSFLQINTPDQFHHERMLTIVPKRDGVYIVLGHYPEHLNGLLTKFIETLGLQLN
jgi:hypothetical protein